MKNSTTSENANSNADSERISDHAIEIPHDGNKGAANFHKQSSSGLNRHKAIVGTCILLSLSFLGLSAVDLKHLIGRRAVLSERLTLTYLKAHPDLPTSYTYTNDRYSDWELDDEYGCSRYSPVESNGLLRVEKHTWDGAKFGYVDRTGKVIIQPQFTSADSFSEGLAGVSIPFGNAVRQTRRWGYGITRLASNSSEKFGFIDESGNFKIEPKYSAVGKFHNGAAPVNLNGEHALIDKSGAMVVKPIFQNIRACGDNFLVTTMRGKMGIISPAGKWLLPAEYSNLAPFNPALQMQNAFPGFVYLQTYSSDENAGVKLFSAMSWSERRQGLVNDRGEILLPAAYDEIDSFHDGIAAVKVNGKIGFVRSNGTFVIKPQFVQATPYAEVIAVRKESGPWVLIDRNGNRLKSPPIDDIVHNASGWFTDGFGAYLENGKIGYLNARGEIAIKPQYEFGLPFVAGHAQVWVGDCWRLIDKHGNFVPGLKVQDLTIYDNGDILVTVPGPFYSLVEFAKINSIKDSIKSWKYDFKDRIPAFNQTWGDD